MVVTLMMGCGSDLDVGPLQRQVDALQQQAADNYKPGFGEFMSSVQVHHEKLWFAGTNSNWLLADFEVHEIEETLEDLKQYRPERKETALLGMLDPALDSVGTAIEKQDTAMFRASYLLLTNNCNSCHVATDHGFNVIKLPDMPPFSDQVFRPQK